VTGGQTSGRTDRQTTELKTICLPISWGRHNDWKGYFLWNGALVKSNNSRKQQLTSVYIASILPPPNIAMTTYCTERSRPNVSSRKPEVMQYNHSGRTNTPVIAYAPTGVLKPRRETFI